MPPPLFFQHQSQRATSDRTVFAMRRRLAAPLFAQQQRLAPGGGGFAGLA
jgi:hypothetical protein